jgi:23S rRNA (cytosine1962-C5)-methyltransferase
MSQFSLAPRGAERARTGHPWIYRSDIAEVRAAAGDIVRVLDPRGRVVGWAFYSGRSQIALRFLTRGDEEAGPALVRDRLAQAIAFRRTLRIDATAYRLVHGEADLLPALVVDRYGEYLVVQTLSQATDRLLGEIVAALVELEAPAGILARNDPKVRLLEGLERTVEVLHGEVPALVEVREGPVRYRVNLRTGQKTGLFLDQRENREAAALYAHGRLLDCFSYDGGFALRLAPRCEETIAVDISEDAAARVRSNAALNGVERIEARAENVFDVLRELDRADDRFDTIVLDPPAFAKTRAAIPKALSGYKEINLRALKLLAPGGYLVTCTCSYHIDEATFGGVVHAAALDAGVPVTVVEKRMQARDHPVLLAAPETYYLKCFILRRVG